MIGRHHQLMVATTHEGEDRKGESVQENGAGRTGPPTLSEGGDVRDWLGTHPSTNATFALKGA